MRSALISPLLTSRPAVAALALAAALTLGGCGGGDDPTVASGPSSSDEAVDETHNDADVAFVNGMTPHHEGAMTMSELAPTRAASDEVKALAERIAAAQGPEIERMAAMAQAWGTDVDAGGAHGGGHSTEMPDDTAALEQLSGAEFDREFLTRMVEHHKGALVMAKAELAEGKNPQAREMAQQIVDAQQAEIAEMERMLSRL